MGSTANQLIHIVNKASARVQRGPAFLRAVRPTAHNRFRLPSATKVRLIVSSPIIADQLLVNREPRNACVALPAPKTLLSPLKYFLCRSNNFKFIPNEFRPLISTNFFNNNINSVYDLRSFVRRLRPRGGTFRFLYSSRPSSVLFIQLEETIWRPQHANTLPTTMNEASSSNIGGVLKRKKNDNSEGDLYNGTVSDKRMKIDHGPVELRSILTRSNFNNSSQSSQFDDSEHQYFTDLQRNSRVRADSDPFQINSENNDSFQKLSVGNKGSVERRSQSELQVLYPESHSIYTDDKSESEASSPDCIDSSEPKKNIENYPPTYMHTPRYSNIQASVGSNIVTTWSKFRDMAINQKPAALNDRPCSLPQIPWGKSEAFWQMICNRDSATVTYRNPEYHDCHEHITPRMRAILLDWLILVSSDYELHRETYYLSMDYLDRYLSNSDSIPNQKLQLIGITCLFMAAKMEEIYPPKLTAFVHVTDGACTTEDVLDMEKKLLMYLRFRLTPVSINYWVQLMLQFICINDSTAEDSLIVPQFPKHLFNRVAHLLDLASLDSNSLRYSYSELAASALTIILNKKIALTISGLSEGNIYNCVEWMSVYWSVILEEYQYKEIDFENDSEQEDGTHVKQRHLVSMDMYDLAQSRFELIQLSRVTPSNLLTPPWNGKKYPVTAEECKPSCSYK